MPCDAVSELVEHGVCTHACVYVHMLQLKKPPRKILSPKIIVVFILQNESWIHSDCQFEKSV